MAYIGKSPSSGIRNRFTYTATAGQTTFSGSDDHNKTLTYTDAEFADVFLNGIKLDKSDYTATSGTSIVLDEAAAVDDIVEVIAFDTFSVFSGDFSQDVTVGGNLTVDTDTLYVDSTNNRVGLGTVLPSAQLHISGDDTTNQVIIENTSASADSAPDLVLQRNSDSPADNDTVGQIVFTGRNDNSQFPTLAHIRTIYTDVTDGTEDAALTFRTMGGGTNSERMRIDSSGNVGIGTGSPQAEIHTHRSGSSESAIRFTNGITGSGSSDGFRVGIDINEDGVVWMHENQPILFGTNNTEQLHINSSGNIFQNNGQTSRERGYKIYGNSTSETYIYGRTNADTSPVFYAQVGGVARAEIESDGSFHSNANSYGGFSDQNYKENIELSGSQWDDIKAVQVKKYSWIHDSLDAPNQLGVVAQDLETSGMGGLVTNLTKLVQQDDGTETVALDDDGNPITYKSVKYSVLYMKAIKALQEAMDKIETLEAENADFETRIAALEAN